MQPNTHSKKKETPTLTLKKITLMLCNLENPIKIKVLESIAMGIAKI
jgi:hypothetical protein